RWRGGQGASCGTTRQRRGDRARKVAQLDSDSLDASDHERVRRWCTAHREAGKGEFVAGGSCRFGHSCICLGMWVGDHPDALSDDRFQFFTAVNHGGAESAVVERREEIVTLGVEPDLETRCLQLLQAAYGQARTARAREDAQLSGYGVAPSHRE